ncbi:hypothetical protein [Halopseudomonas oceani]|uniref:hypothetical protein n=1 Tax=Halopseudomonas oceani TaxID=1708783 RepID=UPI002AA88CB4|nr:hypothetical protein [Halopseudomonas oceani]
MSADPQLAHWQAQWQQALLLWSDHLQLQEPLWLFDVEAAEAAGLTESFAAIRLTSQRVMVNLQEITERGLDDYALEVLAHEIGHHVYAPANMTQHLQLLAVIRQSLPGSEQLAPLVANLYTDLLINHHLQRHTPCQMEAIYLHLKPASATPLWQLYMRIYERLWQLPPETLASAPLGNSEEGDAWLGSRIIKVYGKDWLTGASRFATLLLRYLQDDEQAANDAFGVLADTADAGNGHTGTGVPSLPAIDVLHPSQDPELSEQTLGAPATDSPCDAVAAKRSPGQSLEPQEYYEVLRAAGVDISRHDATVNYYRDAVRPYLLPFPAKSTPAPSEPEREGTTLWEPGDDPGELDWFATLLAGADPIPGVTTHKAVYSVDTSEQPRQQVCDLDLYVDSSGSMPNPQYQLSYPALAGVLLCISALRAGAQVQVTLWSGPRQCLSTDGFIRDEAGALRVLTGFFGGSTSFPLKLLRETYDQPRQTPTQVVVLSDDGVSSMFSDDERGTAGAEISARTLRHCGGAGHWVLDLPMELDSQTGHAWLQDAYEKMRLGRDQGWQVHRVNGLEPMLSFARHFARQYYQASASTSQRAARP